MKHIILLLVAILGFNSANAQWWGNNKRIKGNGEVITKTFNTANFDKISGKSSIDIILVEGKEGIITVEAESNIMEYIEIEVKGNKLEIGLKDGTNYNTRKGINVTVNVESINALSMSGSGDIKSHMNLKSRNLEISVAGSGNIISQVESQNLEVHIAGSGDVTLNGRTENLDANIAGSGDIEAMSLKAYNVEASIAGSGDVSVYCTGGKLRASIVGSGDLTYKGTTSSIKKSVLGSGDITKI